MRTIQKGPEPATLTQHRQQANANYDNYLDKAALRVALVAEQHGLCCYCQSRIQATSNGMKIEHWQCQAANPARQLDFANLLGACLGGQGKPKRDQHCDTRKGDYGLCFSVCDSAHPIDQRIRFQGDGKISADNVAIDGQINAVLNLNLPRLISNRIAVLKAFQQRLQDVRRFDPARELSKWNGTKAGELPEFAQVVVYWLNKRLIRDRA